jgi:RNA polymerase sigma factor (sigma-70 family)
MTSRADLITQWWPLVYRLARRYRGRVQHADYDNLISAGAVGLVKAIDDYDPARGPLPQYCAMRITWAMCDEIRCNYCQTVPTVDIDIAAKPQMSLWRKDLQSLLVKGLTPRERRLLLGVYYESRTQRQLATELGVSPQRVAQIFNKVFQQLRTRLQSRKDEFNYPTQ